MHQCVILILHFFLFLGGISNAGAETKWPLLDDYQAPQKEEHLVVAPTTNTISHGILSILPPPGNREPRNIFSPSLKMTTTQKPKYNR